ncbi:unnamed protein product [Cunninghamella blakesleeana]
MKVNTQRRNSNIQKTSINTVNDLYMLNKEELEEEEKRLDTILNNNTLINSLPDKGKKLEFKKEVIVGLLNKLSSPEEKVTSGVQSLTLEENHRPNIRKKSIADANAEARRINKSSHLLQAGPPLKNDSFDNKAKVKMMSLEESMELQKNIREELQKDSLQRKLNSIKQKKPTTTSDMDTDDISLAMNKLNIGQNSNSSKKGGLDQYSDDSDDDSDEDDDDEEEEDFDRLDSAYDDEEDDDDRSSVDEENFQER